MLHEKDGEAAIAACEALWDDQVWGDQADHGHPAEAECKPVGFPFYFLILIYKE
jgi:hypothetical protein